MKNALGPALIWLLCSVTVSAQTHPMMMQEAQPEMPGKADSSGVISGRIIDITGQPIVNALLYFRNAGYQRNESRNTSTDEQGRFRITGLARGTYYMAFSVPGYLRADEGTQTEPHHTGDTVNLTLTKGGVITGTLMNQNGEPMTGANVQTIQIRDKEGRALPSSRGSYSAEVDDRGVYRIFGLPSGTYIVFAPGKVPSPYQTSPYAEYMPTYYPSSTRDTAQPVTVQVGEEVSNIDIRYRGERGHAISGKVLGIPADSPQRFQYVQLYNLTAHTQETITYLVPPAPLDSFAFYGLADAEYLLTSWIGGNGDRVKGGIGRTRVKVKGADVTGVSITLTSFGAIKGTLAIAPPPKPDNQKTDYQTKCETKHRLTRNEMMVRIRREGKADETGGDYNPIRQMAPSNKGEFAFDGVEAGPYHILPGMLGEDYFMQSLTLPAADPKQSPTDASRSPLNVRPGETITGLTLTVAEGAAAVRGRVVSATAGARLPDRLLVHLVPAEPDAANQVLRYAEASVNADGTFTITNLAPGRYFIIARPAADDAASEASPPPLAWDNEARQQLHQQVLAANTVLDLQPCQRRLDYSLQYAPRAKKKPEDSKAVSHSSKP